MQYTLKDLSVDTELRTVSRGDSFIKLPDLSFDVFVRLIQSAPEPVGVEEFSDSVWRGRIVSDETLAQRITLLRRALSDNPKDPNYIRTVRGLGYAVVGSVAPAGFIAEQKRYAFWNRRISFAPASGLVIFTLVVSLVFLAEYIPDKPDGVFAIESPKSATTLLLERAQQQLRLHQALETDRAITMFREALTREPQRFDGRLNLSFALSTKATKFGGGIEEKKEAEALARALIDEQPENSNAWSALAYALSAQGIIDKSLPAYEKAYQLNPNNTPAISSAAHLQLLMGNFYKALTLENQAKKIGGSSRYAEIQIAQTLELIGHSAAAQWRAKALSINPGQIVILSEIARSHLRQGNAQAALETLALAEGEDQSAPQIIRLRSRATIMLGDFAKAQRLLETISDSVEFDIAVLNAAAGSVAPARELLLSKLTRLDEDTSSDTRIQLAELAAASGQLEEATELLNQAISLGWRDTNWLRHSPYLESLMASKAGQEIEDRITRAIDVQRRLIEETDELVRFINS